MCGIAVQIAPRNQKVSTLDLKKISHRGPDGFGEWISPDGRVWMGHTRLAILDLSDAGHQPMVDGDSKVAIVFNGEIYNHHDLRRHLEPHSWKGSSDTETLLIGYLRWGTELFSKLNGMFSIVIDDPRKGETILARDVYGIKPLYRREFSSGAWRFASEWRALFDTESENKIIHQDQVAAYLRYGCFPEKLLPGSSITLHPSGSWLRLKRDGTQEEGRWENDLNECDDPITMREAPRMIRQAVESSVQRHLLSDVPVGTFLSGGIDSSIISIIASTQMKNHLKTLTVCFEGSRFDESVYARTIAKKIQSDHIEIHLTSDEVQSSISEAILRMDLPSVDAINTYLVCQKSSQIGLKVVLSGLGGDEIFGGYSIFNQINLIQWIRDRLPLKHLDALVPHRWGRGKWKDLQGLSNAEVIDWRRWIYSNDELQKMGYKGGRNVIESREDEVDLFHLVSKVEREGYMRSMLLRDSDQMSMAHSLELRVPFLDLEIKRIVQRMDGRTFRDAGFPKGLLVKSFENLLPKEIYDRPKRGFVLPMQQWMKGALAPIVAVGIREVEERLNFPSQQLNEMRRATEQGRLYWTKLWALIVLGHWMKNHHIHLQEKE